MPVSTAHRSGRTASAWIPCRAGVRSPASGGALKADDVSLINRLARTAERQVRDIEMRLAARDVAPVERERDVRMLASLTRALRDLAALRKQGAAEPGSTHADRDDDDSIPASIDALRQELSRRLYGMAASPPDPKT
jgi:hypothetical protein